MNADEARGYLDEWLCDCADPDAATAALLRLLRLHPLHRHRDEIESWLPDDGVRLLLLYRLNHDGMTEHGGTVEGGWLTKSGEMLRDVLADLVRTPPARGESAA